MHWMFDIIKEFLLIFEGVIMILWFCLRKGPYFEELQSEIPINCQDI